MPSSDNRENILFELIQNVSNQVLELAKSNSEVSTCVSGIKRQLDAISLKQEEIIRTVQDKMSPDRCAFMHDDVKRQVGEEIVSSMELICKSRHKDLKESIFKDMKDGARGWVRTSVLVMKVIAYLGAAFGGGALGYNQITSIIGG